MEREAEAARAGSEVTSLIDEHKQVRDMLAGLESWLGQRAESPEAFMSRLAHEVSCLCELLRPHFHMEDATDVYGELTERAPHFATRLEKLESEHAAFLTELDDIACCARGTCKCADAGNTTALSARVLRLIESIRRHEADENEILMCAHWDDIGGQE